MFMYVCFLFFFSYFFFFFFNDTATTEIYTLSLHDALPISSSERKKIVKEKISELQNLILQFKKNCSSKLIISNFSLPSYSPSGLIETKSEFGFHDMISEINQELSKITDRKSVV